MRLQRLHELPVEGRQWKALAIGGFILHLAVIIGRTQPLRRGCGGDGDIPERVGGVDRDELLKQ